jgi:hypothetical protein
MRASPPLVPSDSVVHFVLCDCGPFGQAYVETDPASSDFETIAALIKAGEYSRPLKVLAVDADAGTASDASRAMAEKILEQVQSPDDLLPGVDNFVAMHTGLRV